MTRDSNEIIQTLNDHKQKSRVFSVWYTMNMLFHRALLVLQEADDLARFHPFHCCTSQPFDGKAKWTAPAQLPPGLSPLLALRYVCSSDLTMRTSSRHLYKSEIKWDLLFHPQSSRGSY